MIITYTAIPIITKGNFLFPDTITIDTNRRILHFKKRSNNLIGYTSRSLMFNNIAAVRPIHRDEWLLFSSVEIESIGGEIMRASGFRTEEAKELKFYLDNLR